MFFLFAKTCTYEGNSSEGCVSSSDIFEKAYGKNKISSGVIFRLLRKLYLNSLLNLYYDYKNQLKASIDIS
jgi:hypothetical protein